MKEDIILIRGLSKSFGLLDVLQSLHLEIPRGIFGLIGPNGAGKTTLFRILLNLIKPDSGNATILGYHIENDSLAIRRRIGVLHERPAYPSFLTPAEYLGQMGRLFKDHKEPEELLDMVGLLYAKDRKIGNLSAGMHQRLGIAQSLLGNPEIVFLDEPTSNLDVTGRADVLKLIGNIHDETGCSFVISSHILSELRAICHNIAFLDNGRILEKGSLLEIMKRHAQERIQVIASDVKLLATILQGASWAEEVNISGTSTLTFKSAFEIDAMQKRIRKVSSDEGIEVFAVSRATDLESIFKEVISDAREL